MSAFVQSPAPAGLRLRVLLAEDNPGNQRLATAILEKRGHQVVVASTGREALAAFLRGGFHVILMDVRMPDMDGLETTAAIRAAEQGSGSRTPIIAMTADSLKEDRERCIAAGMDDYLAKPARRGALIGVVERLASGGAPRRAFRAADPLVPWLLGDRAALLERFENDGPLLQQMIAMFLDAAPQRLAEMRDAAVGGDAKRLERAAHSLRGSIVNFGGAAAAEAAARVVLKARDGDATGVADTIATLEREVGRLTRALADIARDGF